MLREADENNHQLTEEECFEKSVKGNLFAVSRIFAEARKRMNLSEYKAFTMALTSVKWQDDCPDILYLDKKEVAEVVGVHSDPDHLSEDLKRSIGQLPVHSYLEFSDKDKDVYVNGCFISTVAFYKNRVRIRMNPDYLPLFGNLDKNYITMWSSDVYKLRSERSVKFYELLRENSDTRLDVNTGTVGIKFLKELFDIPKDGEGSYMRSQKNGGFDRTAFEKRIIDLICEDLRHTEMIQLIVQPDGKYYEKIKRGNRVIAYKFYWTLSTHPRVATAKEVKEIQEKVDADPQVLKVAKDIVNGEKKSPRKPKNRFLNIEQSDVDYDKIAREKVSKRLASKKNPLEDYECDGQISMDLESENT